MCLQVALERGYNLMTFTLRNRVSQHTDFNLQNALCYMVAARLDLRLTLTQCGDVQVLTHNRAFPNAPPTSDCMCFARSLWLPIHDASPTGGPRRCRRSSVPGHGL